MGDSVTLFDLSYTSNTQSLGCAKIRGDLRDFRAVKEAIEGKDAVFHFGAVSRVVWGQQDPFTCWLTNQLGTLNVLEGCRKAETRPVLFYASSREVYGEPQNHPVKESHPKEPKSVYGMTKLCAERACLSYSAASGNSEPVNPIIFRFSNVYGSERDLPERVIPKFIMKALRGEDIPLYGGEQILDFTFIDDTVSGILKAYAASLNDGDIFGEDFHFVTGRGVSVSELAEMVVDQAHSSSKIIKGSANDFEVQKFVGDPEKSRRMLGYEPRVKLEDGLKILRERMLPTIVAR